MTPLLRQVYQLLQGLDVQWAFCGGYAIDLFLNKETRKHGDIDICVFENDRNRITEYMLANGWLVYQFLGQGKLRVLSAGDRSEFGRNLMCLKDGCKLVKFYPCAEKDVVLHEFFHTGIEHLDYIEFLFNQVQKDHFIVKQEAGLTRELHKTILYNQELPFLAPELALLYKASNADLPEYQHDYELAISHLDDEQLSWFRNGLEILYPQAHPWRED